MVTTKNTEALLFIAPGCTHCPSVMSHLSTLVKEGKIARLEIINIQLYPELAAAHNVRSVPWLKLSDYILTGSYSLAELRQWTRLSQSEEGLEQYIEQQLSDGELNKIITEIKNYPGWLSAIIKLLKNDDTSMQVRLGIDSIMEAMSGTEALQLQVDALVQISETVHPSRLADIIYYLGLSKSLHAIASIEKFLTHENPDIVDACNDAIEEIKSA